LADVSRGAFSEFVRATAGKILCRRNERIASISAAISITESDAG